MNSINSNLSNCLNSKMQASSFEPPITKMNPLCIRGFISNKGQKPLHPNNSHFPKNQTPHRGVWFFNVCEGFEPITNETCRWHVSATSSKTGGYHYFCEAKMQIKSLHLRQKTRLVFASRVFNYVRPLPREVFVEVSGAHNFTLHDSAKLHYAVKHNFTSALADTSPQIVRVNVCCPLQKNRNSDRKCAPVTVLFSCFHE